MNVAGLLKDKSYARTCHISTVSIHPKLRYALYNIVLKLIPADVTKDEVEVVVAKRFSDFKKVHQMLSKYHAKLHRPQAMPELVKAGLFDGLEPNVLEERKLSMECILQFCCQHYHLYTHPLFVNFFETDATIQNVSPGNVPLPTLRADSMSQPHEQSTSQQDDRRSQIISLLDDDGELLQGDELDVLLPQVVSHPSHCESSSIPNQPESHFPASHTPVLSYIESADEHRQIAETLEIAEDYDGALENYKMAIGVLLQGSKSETDEQIRELARQMAADYLSRAERLCSEQQINVASPVAAVQFSEHTETDRRDSAKNVMAWEDSISDNPQHSEGESVLCSTCDVPSTNLQEYMVIGVINHVLLLRHPLISEDLVVKCVPKAEHLWRTPLPPILPQPNQVPYHVSLFAYFETVDTVYLILRRVDMDASGCSRLCDWVHHYHVTTNTAAVEARSVDPSPRDSASKMNNEYSVYQGRLCIHSHHESDVIQRSSSASQIMDLNTSQSIHTSHPSFVGVQHNSVSVMNDERISTISDGWKPIPEQLVRRWCAEVVTAVGYLHKLGLRLGYLYDDDLLLGPGGHIFLTYRYQLPSCPPCWYEANAVTRKHYDHKRESTFICDEPQWRPGGGVAPEFPHLMIHSSDDVDKCKESIRPADWFSVGTVLYPLFASGQSWRHVHPRGITAHTLPNNILPYSLSRGISREARDFILGLLAYHPHERLGCSALDAEEVKNHPYFDQINWDQIAQEGYM